MKCIEIKAMKRLNQKGFTIVQAVFVLVVLGMLGAYMVTMSTVQQATTTQALMQARAYQAAKAGIEWGIIKALGGESGDSFTVAGTGCDVAVTISTDPANPYREGPDDINIYHIEAAATYASPGSPDYVSRTLEVTIHD